MPDATARVFATRRSGFIAALVPSLNNSNFADTVRGMSDVFHAAGLQMLLGDTEYSLSREEDLIRAFLKRRPEALVLTGGAHSEGARKLLTSADVPIVETWDLPKEPLGDIVGFSNEDAGAAMVRYLYERGRRRLGFVGGKTTFDTRGTQRRAGFKKAARALRLPNDRIILTGEPSVSMAQGAEALDAMPPDGRTSTPLSASPICRPSACSRNVKGAEFDVPARIAIAGFGDFDVARCATTCA